MRRKANGKADMASQVNYYLEPGYIYFSKEAAVVRTVLGSCVAVCLWDGRLKYGGMSHYLYPSTRDPEKATPKYGNVAITALVRMMDKAGCRRKDIKAQILGGAQAEDATVFLQNTDNVRVAREALARKNIKVVSEDVGGTMGRKVILDLGTGEVAVLKVHKIRQTDWEPEIGA
jgi:chemotaxis protein CheD